MKKPFNQTPSEEETFTRLIGLGEKSLQKSYFPQLQKKIRELEKSEYRYRLLAENVTDVIWLLDLNCCFQYLSPSIQKMSGFSPAELMGLPVDRLLSPDSAKQFMDAIARALRNPEDAGSGLQKELELQQTGKDGSTKWIEVGFSVFFHKPEKKNLILGIARDITSRKAAEQEKIKIQEQLVQAQKMESIGILAGGVAHDFNNLLTIINGYAEMALEDLKEDHPVFKKINAIQDAGKRAETLTRQLLGFSRKQIYHPIPLNINETLLSLNKMLGRLIGEDISIEMVLDDTIDSISADQSQIEQIFINLIINARDALKPASLEGRKKRITIETGQTAFDSDTIKRVSLDTPGPYTFFSVSDNGMGIRRELLKRIFEPFFTTKAKHEGTGLGLSMIYGIVKQNKGSVQVYSEEGRGTMFKIYWPASHTERKANLLQPEPAIENLSGNESILIVEDDRDVCLFAANCLLSLGYEVHKAFDGEQALSFLHENKEKTDLIITDLIMPNLSGKALAKKALAHLPAIKIIYVSGYTDNHIVHDGLLEPGVNFLQKPYSQQNLAKMVRKVLNRKHIL
ncbi:MAG: PAS domain S-box protein [Pseudomonadota bacterium]